MVSRKGCIISALFGSIAGFFSSAIFAIGPALQLSLIEMYGFRLRNVSPATLHQAETLIRQANGDAIQLAIMQHGFDCMIGGAFLSAITYFIYVKYVHWMIKFAIRDFFGDA